MPSPKLTLRDVAPLLNSIEVPRLGFGVYRSAKNQCTASCLIALTAGYRHIDTAQYYENEAEVGSAIRQSGIPRSDIFVTTKILATKGSVDKSYQSALESVKNIDGSQEGYVDMFLVHSAMVGREERKELWLALERLFEAGKAKSIGVSNYGIGHIEEMKNYAKIWPPHANQLEMHPWCQQREIDEYCRKEGIIIEAYCPLVRNTKADDPTLKAIAHTHDVKTAQVLIRYALQKDWVPLPKSDSPSRIAANAEVYGFELQEQEMRTLDALDQGADGSICHCVNNMM